jgi:hypothetical protein
MPNKVSARMLCLGTYSNCGGGVGYPGPSRSIRIFIKHPYGILKRHVGGAGPGFPPPPPAFKH